MTIAAALMCRDGIALGSDTEYTSAYSLKVQGPKLFEYRVEGLTVVFAGAGDVDFTQMTVQRIVEGFEGRKISTREVIEIVSRNIQHVYKKHVYPFPGSPVDKPFFDLLIAIAERGHPQKLFKTSRTGIVEVDTYVCLGTGEHLGRFIADQLYHTGISLVQGAVLCTEMLIQAIRYVPGCGGEPKVWSLMDSGSIIRQDKEQTAMAEALRLKLTDLVSTTFFELLGRPQLLKNPQFVTMLTTLFTQLGPRLFESSGRYDPTEFREALRSVIRDFEELSQQP